MQMLPSNGSVRRDTKSPELLPNRKRLYVCDKVITPAFFIALFEVLHELFGDFMKEFFGHLIMHVHVVNLQIFSKEGVDSDI